MGLETPIYLEQFVTGNPAFQDQRHEGDDHIRNMKSALKNTFPGLGGRIFRKRNVTGSGAINLSDNMTLLNVTGGVVLTPAAASVLGNGFMAYVRSNGGSVTIDPAEPINGGSTYTVPAGYMAILFSDGTEFFTFLVYQEVPPTVQAFSAGTKIVFQQTSAPTGWTKLLSSTHNNAGLRFTTGTVGVGGADDFTTVFGTGKATAGHSITEAQTGPHAHSYNTKSGVLPQSGSATQCWVGDAGATTGSAGGGASHAHNLSNLNLKYVDCIVASKD